jgi:hypothetical protein
VSKEDIDKLLPRRHERSFGRQQETLGVLCRSRSERRSLELNKVGFAKYPSPLMIVIAGNQKLNFYPRPLPIIGSKMSHRRGREHPA